MSRADDAIMALYEDAALRDELTDELAAPLLAWAESAVGQIDARAADDGDFETQTAALRRLIKRINRWVGQSSAADAEAGENLKAAAAELGFTLDLTGLPVGQAAVLAALIAQLSAPLPKAQPPQPEAPPTSLDWVSGEMYD